MEHKPIDRAILDLYDEYTHKPLERRVFLHRLAELAGGTAAATVILPLLENNYARAATIAENDARLQTGYLHYPGAKGDVRAYYAKPKGDAKQPSLIVVHENRGLNPHIEDVARRAAAEGFFALAPDLLSAFGGTPKADDAARAAFARIDTALAVADLSAAVDYLGSRPDVSGRIGVVGFCWGGGMTNRLVMASPRVAAAAPFYGPVPEKIDASRIKAALMLHYAGLDDRVNAGIPRYEAALKAAGVRYTIYMYPGANHAFHNDTAGERYNKDAAELAWSRTMAFFKQNLR